MSTAPNYIPHYTIADYEQWSGDWELWQGIPIAMTPSPFGIHQHVAAKLLVDIANQLEAQNSHCVALHEIDWVVSEDTVVRPDVVVVDSVPARHLVTAPAFIVEVLSAKTSEKDRTVKFALYESQRVGYYLMLDPTQKRIDQFAHLHQLCERGAYEQIDASSRLKVITGGVQQLELQLHLDKILSSLT